MACMASASAWPRAPPARVALGPSWGAALRPGTCPRGVPAPAAKKRGRRTAEGGSPRLDTLSVDQLRHAVKTIAGDLEEVYSDADRIEAADARGLSAAELARERLLCTRLAGLALARTRISSAGAVAGMGVFAARDIGAGELITCYPGDASPLSHTSAVVFRFSLFPWLHARPAAPRLTPRARRCALSATR